MFEMMPFEMMLKHTTAHTKRVDFTIGNRIELGLLALPSDLKNDCANQ